MENKQNNSKHKAQIKYINNNYKRFRIDIKNDDFEKLQKICKRNNTTITTEIKKFLNSYIEKYI